MQRGRREPDATGHAFQWALRNCPVWASGCLGWIVGGVVTGVGAGALYAFLPPGNSAGREAWRVVVSGVASALGVLLLGVVWALLRAPYEQRRELAERLADFERSPHRVAIEVAPYHANVQGNPVTDSWQALLVRVNNLEPGNASFTATLEWLKPDGSEPMEHGPPCDAGWAEWDGHERPISGLTYADLYVVAVQHDPPGAQTPLRLIRSTDPWKPHIHAKHLTDGHPIRVTVRQIGVATPSAHADFAIEMRPDRPYLVPSSPRLAPPPPGDTQ